MRRQQPRYIPILAAILVGACGGGGGGGGTVTQPPAEPALVQISLTNQDNVARAAVGSIMPFTSVASVGVAPTAAAERGALTNLTMKGLNSGVFRNASAADIARPLAVYSSTEPCQAGGTATVTLNDADNSGTLTPGDSLAMSFVQCSDSPTSSINGGMTFVFSSVAVTPTTMDATGSMNFQQLLMIDDATSFSLNGGVSFSLNETMMSNGVRDVGSYTVTAAGLTVSNSGSAAGYVDTFTYRAGYTVTEEDFIANVPGVFATSMTTASGNFQSNVLGADLSLATAQAFRLTEPDQNPSEGILMVSGKSNTKLGLTAISSSQIRIDVCDDGDNVWEGTKSADWSSVFQ